MVLQRVSNRMIVMPYNGGLHHRRSIRLPGYDYAQAGAYFVTLCTHQCEWLFGEVVNGEMQLNAFGCVVEEEWLQTPIIRPYVQLDTFVIMPNHFHGIIVMTDDGRGTAPPCPYYTGQFGKPVAGSLPTIMRSYKSAVTKRINALRNTPSAPVWQRNYHEHVIRNETALSTIRTYIANNPLHWAADRYNPVPI